MDESTDELLARYWESVRRLDASNRELAALLRELAEREEFPALAHKVVELIRTETATWPARRPPKADPTPPA